MAASDEMLYGDILDSTESPRTPVEDEAYGDLFDDVLKGSEQDKMDSSGHVKLEITEADIALLDTDEKPATTTTAAAATQVTMTTASGVGVAKAKAVVTTQVHSVRPSASLGRPATIYQEPVKKNSLFIGGFTWWTSDKDILAAFSRCGFASVRALKIYENRTNGQSKGFAQVELGSEDEAYSATEKVQEIEINGQKVLALHSMRTSPHQFELKCKGEGTGIIREPTPSVAKQPPRIQAPPPPPMNSHIARPPVLPANSLPFRGPLLNDPSAAAMPMMPGMVLPGMLPGNPGLNPFDPLSYLRPPMPGMPPPLPPGLAALQQRPPPPMPDAMAMAAHSLSRSSAPHVNPAFLFGGGPGSGGLTSSSAAMGMPGGLGAGLPGGLGAGLPGGLGAGLPGGLGAGLAGGMGAGLGGGMGMGLGGAMGMGLGGAMGMGLGGGLGMGLGAGLGGGGPGPMGGFGGGGGVGLAGAMEEDELSDVMHRNQQVSTTAIQRAQDDAAAGDVESALDTLRMAVNIIKQSSVAKMDSTQVLIKSLQDCMGSIEGQSSRHSSSRRHDDKDRSGRRRDNDRSHDREYRSSRHYGNRDSRDNRERDRSRDRRRY